MQQRKPHIIVEGSLEYALGSLEGHKICYDFPKILTYLDAKGKLLFGTQFKIHEEDKAILFKLSNYFIRDFENCRKAGIDPDKGILLSGPVGCGKTSLMKLLRHIVPHRKAYQIIPARNIAFAFNHIGYRIIEDYGDSNFYCFDDLGVEPLGRYFGKDCNVMGEVILSRYELYLRNRILTHATTNLNAMELEERYGERVRSRMRQMFNLIAFDKESSDKRK
ncbi:ATPase [Maribacter polysaccharolyticus]|uniref:ATPase n=1 Tax=Maribacter polysaccharolyticus TaxID=3020831 RepID=UPI00237F26F9|nr:ATPase [Maribacter polysaccharolyticus]MDE3744090.1 ATPase [Maribacter polysaccharolyticus]